MATNPILHASDKIWRSTSRQRTSIVHPRSHPTSCAFGLETHNNIPGNVSQSLSIHCKWQASWRYWSSGDPAKCSSWPQQNVKTCLLWNFKCNDNKTPTKTRGIQLSSPIFQATSPIQMLFLITTMKSSASIQSTLHVVGMESKMIKDLQITVKTRCLCAFPFLWCGQFTLP